VLFSGRSQRRPRLVRVAALRPGWLRPARLKAGICYFGFAACTPLSGEAADCRRSRDETIKIKERK